MKRANVWMIQAGDRLRFPLKPLLPLRICRHIFRQNLDRDVPPEPRILRAVHLAIPPAPSGARTSYGPIFVPDAIAMRAHDYSAVQVVARNCAYSGRVVGNAEVDCPLVSVSGIQKRAKRSTLSEQRSNTPRAVW